MEWKKNMKAIKFSNKSNLEKLKLQHPTGKTPFKVFASDCESLCVFVQPSSLPKIISEEFVNYYNIHNRFGVKLPVINHETAYEMFDMSIFKETNIFINQDYQQDIDIKTMEKIFKLGFNVKVKNSPTNDYLFRNYFDKKHKMVPAGPFYIYFYKVDFKIFDKVLMYCNPKNAFKEIFFKK